MEGSEDFLNDDINGDDKKEKKIEEKEVTNIICGGGQEGRGRDGYYKEVDKIRRYCRPAGANVAPSRDWYY